MAMAGDFLQSLGQIAGAVGIGWRCRHCNQWSNEYTGNIIDGTSRCPNCGLDPNPFLGMCVHPITSIKLNIIPAHLLACCLHVLHVKHSLTFFHPRSIFLRQ